MLTPVAIANVWVNEERMENELEVLDFEKDVTDCLRRKNLCMQGPYLIFKDTTGKFRYGPLDAYMIGQYNGLPRVMCEPLYLENTSEIAIKDTKLFPELKRPVIYSTQAAKNDFLARVRAMESLESEHGPIYTFLELLDNPAWK